MHARLSRFPLKVFFSTSIRLSSISYSTQPSKHEQHYTRDVLYRKLQDLNNWYTRVIGLDEVKQYQDRVVKLQEKLLEAQEKRREVSKLLAEIRKRSNELQDQIHKVKRQDDLQRFLELMKEETEVLTAEKETTDIFSECDREERELFLAFTNAVRDSHEKQRAQLEYTKYFGLVLSIVGSFLTFCYSSLRKHEIKRFIEQNMSGSVTNLEPVINQLNESQKQLHIVAEEVSQVIDYNKMLSNTIETISNQPMEVAKINDNILRTINRNHNEVRHLIENAFSNSKEKVPYIEPQEEEEHAAPFECEDNRSNNVIFYGMILYGCYLVYRTIIAS